MSGTQLQRVLTLAEVAKHLRVTPQGLFNLRQRGDGPRITRLGGRVFVREDHLQQYLDAHAAPEGKGAAKDEPTQGDERGADAEGANMEPAPNHATEVYRARVAAQTAKAAKERHAKGRVSALREQQRRAGGGGGSPELRPAAASETQSEASRRLRAEQASRG